MATVEILDVRRTDLRTNVLANPYWLTSGNIVPAADDLAALLFSFPITKSVSPGYKPFFIDHVVLEIVTAFDGTASITLASGTLATDAVTTGGDVTEVDADEYMVSDNIDETAIGYYPASSAGTEPDWQTAKILEDGVMPYYHVPADTTVPCIYAVLTGGTITVGSARLHILISEIPA